MEIFQDNSIIQISNTRSFCSNSMAKILCPVCKKMVDKANHPPKHINAAGNPMSPADKTISSKFWSS